MQFTTPVPVAPSQNPITYKSRLLLLGSCFAENMADKFRYFGFRQTANPFGIIYQAQALETIVRRSLYGDDFSDSIIEWNEGFHSFDAHSDMSRFSADETLSALRSASTELNNAIADASHIIITLGTAWQYRLQSTGKTVANCHKLPSSHFVKELATIESIESNLHAMADLIHKVNPNARLILTVSPVRHIKDGFVENQLSKSHLIAAMHGFIGQSNSAEYFPSYEIVMDELRDYRFYACDMLHPSQTAIDYIWEKFAASGIDESSRVIMAKVEKARRAMNHRPFNPESARHKEFEAQLKAQLFELERDYGIVL